MTEPQLGGTYEDLLAAARLAERAGLPAFARSDHYYWSGEAVPATDAFAAMAGLARETSRVRLVVLVSPVTFRHPAVLAKSAATIDEMSGGRFDLGVGAGWMELEHQAFGMPFPPTDERFQLVEETLGYLRAAFGPPPSRFEGKHFRLDATVQPRPAGLRLLVGGSGARRTPELAGRFADEYNHSVTSPHEVGPKIEVMRRAASAAGRDPSGILVSMMGPVIVGRDREEVLRSLAVPAGARDVEPEELAARWTERGVPLGTPAEIQKEFSALEEVGVTRYYLQHLDLTDLSPVEAALELLA